MLVPTDIYCCDADAIIYVLGANLIKQFDTLAKNGRVKMPLRVHEELLGKSPRLESHLDKWKEKYDAVVNLGSDFATLTILPEIETKYGQPFRLGGIQYGGFWNSASGRKSADAQVVALARSRGLTVISNDITIHGACLLERIKCGRWETIARVLLDLGR